MVFPVRLTQWGALATEWNWQATSGWPTRSLQRTDTEEELKRIRNRQELYEARKQLHEQEVQDAARNRTEVTEHTMALAASVRFPKAPAAPPNVLMAVQNHLPLAALRQALPAAHGEGHIEVSESLAALAWQDQHARLTPPSGQGPALTPLSGQGQATVGVSEVATQKMESSTEQSEEPSMNELEAQAMKWFGMLQAKQKEMEARAEA